MGHHTNLPFHLYVNVNNKFLGPNMPVGVTTGIWHGVYAREHQTLMCHALLKSGAHWSGMPLHGPPGNGKTNFIRHLARKYSLPIYVIYFSPDYSNLDIARMFSEVPRRCIVLFEDFDNYFNGRECTMKNDQVKFTFDSIINALDGVHNDYRGVVFSMTVNNIDRIDTSLKCRPSRFKFVREFGNPNSRLRARILRSTEAAEATEGLSLDEVFNRRAA